MTNLTTGSDLSEPGEAVNRWTQIRIQVMKRCLSTAWSMVSVPPMSR